VKTWEEMDPNEKLDFLRHQLHALQNSMSAAILGLNQRMRAIEEKAKNPPA
jgi:hypothetical protein